MDYFKQRREFRRLKQDEIDVSVNQDVLYRELLDYGNDVSDLDKSFTLKNSALMDFTGISSERTLINVRRSLVNLGLIEYVKGNKKSGKKPQYKIVKLYKDYGVSTKVSTNFSVKPSTEVLTNTRQDKTITKDKKASRKSDKPTYADDNPNYQLANKLYLTIKNRQEDFKTPNLQKWANDIRLMNERDGRTHKQIENMIEWSQNSDFWSAIILSANKLRTKYDVMKVQSFNNNIHTIVEKKTDWSKNIKSKAAITPINEEKLKKEAVKQLRKMREAIK